jgi:hypothetical protein
MSISEAVRDVRECGANVGLTKVLQMWDDEDLIVFALNYLTANIEDAIYVDEEDDSESFVLEALPRTVVYTFRDGDIDPDTGETYLDNPIDLEDSDWIGDMGDN